MSQTSKSDPAAQHGDPPAPFRLAWDPDPLVVCSRRTRNLSVPSVLLIRDATQKELAEWANPTGMSLPSRVTITLNAGATFLGAAVSMWHFRALQSANQVPKGPPPDGALAVLWMKSSEDNMIKTAPRFKGGDTQDLDPAKVCAAWCRVMEHMHNDERRALEQNGHAPVTLFTPQNGFDAPEVVVCRVSSLFTMQSVEGQHAQPHVMSSIKYMKDGRHLGALHDYAIRHPGGNVIAMECQKRLLHAPGLGPVA